MKLNEQVTSLELSRKLKKLGVKQESLWYWKSRSYLGVVRSILVEGIPELKNRAGFFSAFTVAELINMMSKSNRALRFTTIVNYTGDAWYIPPVANYPHFRGKTQADAFAKMLCYLIENNLFKKEGEQ